MDSDDDLPPAEGEAQEAAGPPPVVFDVYRRDCAAHSVLRILTDRWVVLAIGALAMGTLRHSELARKLAGVTPRSLTRTLRELERDGLVDRAVIPGPPLRVEYSLTPMGRDLARVLRPLCRWSETHAARILLARAKADGRVLSEDSWKEIAGLE